MATLSFKKRILPDAGKFLVVLKSVNEVDNKFYDPKKDSSDRAKQRQWIFEYVDKPGMEISAYSTPRLTIYKGKKSKALSIVEALLNKELSDDEKENLTSSDDLIDKKCFLTIKHEKNEDGQVYAKILDFEPEQKKLF